MVEACRDASWEEGHFELITRELVLQATALHTAPFPRTLLLSVCAGSETWAPPGPSGLGRGRQEGHEGPRRGPRSLIDLGLDQLQGLFWALEELKLSFPEGLVNCRGLQGPGVSETACGGNAHPFIWEVIADTEALAGHPGGSAMTDCG